MKLATPMRINSAPKLGTSGVHRTVSSEKTWEHLRRLLGKIGITRLADITGLDRVGIPTYSAVRPTDLRSSVTVTCGKGMHRIDAKVGAVMESLEYKVGEPDEGRGLIARMDELEGAAVAPQALHLPPWIKAAGSLRLEWVQGWDLVQEEPIWIPAASVYSLDCRGDFLFAADTNGLASGNCIEEAICHALAEVIERDADSIAQSYLSTEPGSNRYPLLDLATLPASSRTLVERFQRCGIEVYVRNITSELGVACCTVTCADRSGDGLLLHGGSGAHLVAEVALNRALTEAAQSRAADIQGSREDLVYWRRVDRDSRNLSASGWNMPDSDRKVSFAELPTLCTGDVADDIAVLVERLRSQGFARVAVVDFTPPELGIPVVRVIVPGLEISSVNPWRAGPRLADGARRVVEERVSA